jgi:CheY-like chemotaxis protein
MSKRIILYVEDDDAAYSLFRIVVGEVYLNLELHRACDGEQALSFLRKTGAHHDAPRPDLVLLDLNLPNRHGFDVLSEMKATESLRSIPVIIFSSSSAPADKTCSLALGAEKFVSKPNNLDLFVEALKSALLQ